MAEEDQHHKEQPIIIKKIKKGGGHGHHGGAWKVAYADFVTAMMAFFIVMWILASSEKVKQNVSEYFNHPERFDIFTGEKKTGPLPVDIVIGQNPSSSGELEEEQSKGNTIISFDKEMADTLYSKFLEKAKKDSVEATKKVEEIGNQLKYKFENLMTERPELKEILSSIKIEMTKEGLRIELIETTESLFFEVGSAKLRPDAINVLKQLAEEIGKLPNYVEIEGHTDSRSYNTKTGYNNWDLSSDRALAARRILDLNGLWNGQIVKVTGFADKKLRNSANPFDASNRRISILIKQISANQFLPQKME
ncbi:MAG TPA: flagellar motor protein MotB [Candidatus Kapabacteria bacterium]|nr:flagellar motor protein MotB [Candidatus Kapabacteria bacterium]